ncbi:MAG: FAD/NAD(P)-binding oxidoreductase [Cyanobacteriota/Melainabacteria group bacterium]
MPTGNAAAENKIERVVILGGGTAGISVAARLRKALRGTEIVVVEPAATHYYQPLWTLVGAGVFDKDESARAEKGLIPDGVKWLEDTVERIDPEKMEVITRGGKSLSYSVLVVSTGLKILWDGVKGLAETLGKNGVCSNYSIDYVSYTWDCIREFKGGTAIFTHPNTPIKCGGAPQKIAYLAEDYFSMNGVRENSRVVFASAQSSIFSVAKYARSLEQVIERKKIEALFQHNLVEIIADKKEAVFQRLDNGEEVRMQYDMLHVTPPMGPPDFIRESSLGDQAGWVDVDNHTLQHTKYKNIFSLGDSAGLPTSKTAAAIRKQAPVAVANILAFMGGEEPQASYDGYTSCPLVTGYKNLILAEFDYALNPQESFPFDQSKERYSMYLFKKYVIPVLYWEGMLKGRA